VATAGLEPSAISFPFRKVFQNSRNTFIRIGEILSVNPNQQIVSTSLGDIRYDYLVIALGADTNFFGMKSISEHAIPMKSVSEALSLRNRILQTLKTH
jgi:NADH dehydrogenase